MRRDEGMSPNVWPREDVALSLAKPSFRVQAVMMSYCVVKRGW